LWQEDGNGGGDDDDDPDNMTYEVCGYGMFLYFFLCPPSFQVTCKACEQNGTMHIVSLHLYTTWAGNATDFLSLLR
jgi:hypothetical protein